MVAFNMGIGTRSGNSQPDRKPSVSVTEGFVPMRCANFVLKHSRKDQNRWNRLDEIEIS